MTQTPSNASDASISNGYRSPAGTWEPVLKSVLEDPSYSLPAFRVLLYLATKPAGWKTSVVQIMTALHLGRDVVKAAVAELRQRGHLTAGGYLRNPATGRLTGRQAPTVNRATVVCAGHTESRETPPSAPPAETPLPADVSAGHAESGDSRLTVPPAETSRLPRSDRKTESPNVRCFSPVREDGHHGDYVTIKNDGSDNGDTATTPPTPPQPLTGVIAVREAEAEAETYPIRQIMDHCHITEPEALAFATHLYRTGAHNINAIIAKEIRNGTLAIRVAAYLAPAESTTDTRVLAGLALANKYRAEENRPPIGRDDLFGAGYRPTPVSTRNTRAAQAIQAGRNYDAMQKLAGRDIGLHDLLAAGDDD